MSIFKISAIIPARSGSKSIPHKNIRVFNDKPLIAHSICQAKKLEEMGLLNEIIVSTDSIEYKKVAEEWGARVPFLRPAEISGDESTDYEFLKHFVDWKIENEPDSIPDIIIQLRPTYPNRSIEKMADMITIFKKEFDEYDSLRTVVPVDKTPFKMYFMENNDLKPLFYTSPNGIKEPYNVGRQILPPTYLHNGYVDILKTDTLLKKNSISGERIRAYLMDNNETDDIDYENDWVKAEKKLKRK